VTGAGPRTLFDKIWSAHVVQRLGDDSACVLYIDCHLVGDIHSPQAFEGLWPPLLP
jgi:3-isopropylmalate/(R)-2-methylmalate dehydratase large subunit